MSLKRERSINFTKEETELLINLVAEKKYILENKKSDAVTWQAKEKCWKELETSFNCASGSTYRTAKNLRIKYEGIKRETRKKSSEIHAETYHMEGSPNTATTFSNNETNDMMEGSFDSDQVLTTDIASHEPKDAETSDASKIWSQWKPTLLRSNQHPVLSKPKPKRPFEKVAESKLEISKLQKIILEEELLNKRAQWAWEEKDRKQRQKRWAFEEEERNHKREIWKLKKMLFLKKINDMSYIIFSFHNIFLDKAAI